jgi:hypothetical protein
MFVPIVHVSCVNPDIIGIGARAGERAGPDRFLGRNQDRGLDTQGTYFPAAACHPINHIQELP